MKKIVLILQVNFGQPSRNSILPNYPLKKVWRLWEMDQSQLTKASLSTTFENISVPLTEIWKANQYCFETLPGANLKKIVPIKLRKVNFLLKLRKNQTFLKLRNLKRKKAFGLDNFPSGLLKDGALVLTKPLTFIINLSLETWVVPSEWIVAMVSG